MTVPTQHITLKINSVVGTGDPFDAIMLIPLIADWRVPNHCVFCYADGRRKEQSATITRLLRLREPFDGHMTLGCCEAHWQEKCATAADS